MTVLEALGTVATSFGVCFAVSFLPVGGGVEVYVLATSALLPTRYVAPLVVAAAAASVAAKTVVHLGASRTMPRLLKGKRGRQLVARIEEGPWMRRGFIVSSALVSVPPFYAMALATGMLRTPRTEFVVISLIGQSIRFGALWAIPQIVAALTAG